MRESSVLLGALCALAACSSDTGPQPAPLPDIAQERAVRVLWSASIGDADDYVLQPALKEGAVYASAHDGGVTRLDALDGRRVWRVSLDAALASGVGSDGRIAVVAGEKGEVFALDAASGKLLWRARVTSEVLAVPAIAGELVLVRSVDNRVFALGAADGKRRWVYQHPVAALVVRAPAGMTADADSVYVGFPGGKLVALSLASGGVRWEVAVATPRGATELERVTDVVGVPVLLGREICAAAYQGRIACYDLRNGTQSWVREMSSASGLSLDAGYAYVSDEKGAVHALDRTNGRSLWKQDKLANRALSVPLALGAEVAVGDFEGYVHFLARDTGAFIARFPTGAGPIRGAMLRLPSGILVQTQEGRLYALAL